MNLGGLFCFVWKTPVGCMDCMFPISVWYLLCIFWVCWNPKPERFTQSVVTQNCLILDLWFRSPQPDLEYLMSISWASITASDFCPWTINLFPWEQASKLAFVQEEPTRPGPWFLYAQYQIPPCAPAKVSFPLSEAIWGKKGGDRGQKEWKKNPLFWEWLNQPICSRCSSGWFTFNSKKADRLKGTQIVLTGEKGNGIWTIPSSQNKAEHQHEAG